MVMKLVIVFVLLSLAILQVRGERDKNNLVEGDNDIGDATDGSDQLGYNNDDNYDDDDKNDDDDDDNDNDDDDDDDNDGDNDDNDGDGDNNNDDDIIGLSPNKKYQEDKLDLDDDNESWLQSSDEEDEFIDENESGHFAKTKTLDEVSMGNKPDEKYGSEENEDEIERLLKNDDVDDDVDIDIDSDVNLTDDATLGIQNDPKPLFLGRVVRSAGRFVRRTVRKVRTPIQRIIRHVREPVRRIVRHIREPIRRIVRHVRIPVRSIIRVVRHIRLPKIGKTIGGVVRSISNNKIGGLFGKIAQEGLNFLTCAVPGITKIDTCVKEAIRSAGSCTRGGSSCCMKLGGRRSNCLRIAGSKNIETFKSIKYGPLIISGRQSPSLTLSVEACLNTGKVTVGFYGYIKANAKVNIHIEKSRSKTYEKRIELAATKTVFKKLIILTVGSVPVPVLLEVKLQPVARVKIVGSATGSFDATFELENDARIELDYAKVTYDPSRGLPTVSAKASQNLNNLRIAKSVILQGTASLKGTLSIGTEIVVSINGVPLKIFPALQFKLDGTVSGTTDKGGCVTGSLMFSTNLRMLVIPDLRKLTSVSQHFKGACGNIANVACKNPAARAAGCFSKHFNPCRTMKDGCDEFGKALDKIPNPIGRNPTLGSFDLLRRNLYALAIGKQCRKFDFIHGRKLRGRKFDVVRRYVRPKIYYSLMHRHNVHRFRSNRKYRSV